MTYLNEVPTFLWCKCALVGEGKKEGEEEDVFPLTAHC